MNMARARMASAVEPPPAYFSPNDTLPCAAHLGWLLETGNAAAFQGL